MSIINPGTTKNGIVSASTIDFLVEEQAQTLDITKQNEKDILLSLGATAVASKGSKREENIQLSLHNAIAERVTSVGESISLQPWQEAFDWNTSIELNKHVSESNNGSLVYEYSKLLEMWRSTSPFTRNEDGSFPQVKFQQNKELKSVVPVLRRMVQSVLKEKGIEEVTLHKALRWENGNESIPLSMKRPSWYVNPVADRQDDGFDEEIHSKFIGAKHILLCNYTGFATDYNAALQMARYNREGDESNYYAVASGTFPASSIVSIPSLGFSSLTKMEVVVDSRTIQKGSFQIMFGRKS